MAQLALIPIGMAIATYMAGGAAAGATAITVGGISTGLTITGIGGMIGGMVGGWIDSTFTFPALFGGSGNISGQKLDDLQVQTASEGSPIKWCYGDAVRVAGTVIWASELKPVKKKKKSGKKSQKYYVYYVDVAVAVCEGDIQAINKVWADAKVLYDNTGSTTPEELGDPRYDNMTVYLGGTDQDPDPTMESALGAGNVPSYKGIAYVVFKNLLTTDFGNRIPSFNFLVKATSTSTVKGGIEAVLKRASWDTSYYDTSGISDYAISGYMMSGPQELNKQLEPLMMLTDVIATEDGGVLYFKQKESAVRNLKDFQIAAMDYGSDPVSPVTYSDKSDLSTSADVVVKFMDPTNDYQTGSARARRNIYTAPSVTEVNLNMTLSGKKAMEIANRALWSQVAQYKTAEASLPPSQLDLLEGDLINIPDGGEYNSIRISSIDMGFNGIINISGVLEQVQSLTPSGDLDSGIVVGNTPIRPAMSVHMEVLNIPPLNLEAVNTPGIYVAVCRETPSDNYYGALIAMDSGVDQWVEIDSFSSGEEATIGATTSDLSSFIGTPGDIDTVNTVNVELIAGELESVDSAATSNGINWALIGNEIIAFQTATQTGPRTYTLSNIRRGLRDTVDAMGTTTPSGATFVLLEEDGLLFVPMVKDASAQMKAVPGYQQITAVASVSAVCTGENVKPFRPIDITRGSGSGGDIVIQWSRQSRQPIPIGISAQPLDEPFEIYDLIICEVGVSELSPLRTVSVTSAQTYNYTSALQTTDGRGTPGDPVDVYIYQRGNYWDQGNRGKAASL